MGNYVSCTLVGPVGKQSREIKVIFPAGEILRFHQPIKAAEIMLEKTGFFLNNVKSLQIGKRFSALNADEDLEMANIYVMFPMRRVNSVVTAADMGVLFLTANSVAKRDSQSRVKILPESMDDDECLQIVKAWPAAAVPVSHEVSLPRLKLDEFDEFSEPEFKHKLLLSRSKKPALETIVEEPIWIR